MCGLYHFLFQCLGFYGNVKQITIYLKFDLNAQLEKFNVIYGSVRVSAGFGLKLGGIGFFTEWFNVTINFLMW